ncbi:MAG: TIGR02594 family protein [Aquabacterium sp.]|uniref:TIGR02594 family protein n=1 Tax=Aquabacterium sp. TaxID=1872578 RepID=UPI003BAF6B60
MTRWIDNARKYIGVKEIPGPTHNPIILGFWRLAKLAGIKNDEIPWCSGFACAVMEEAGIRSPRTDGAKNWLGWGVALPSPVYGCIVVFRRPGGWHMGFVVGLDAKGNLMVLGGNQGNQVSIAAFARDRVEGYRYPMGEPIPQSRLPLLAGVAASTSEA